MKYLIVKITSNTNQSAIIKDDFILINADTPRFMINQITSWSSSSQVDKVFCMHFDNLDDAVNFAKDKKLDYKIVNKDSMDTHTFDIKSYSDNFTNNRLL